MKGDDIIIKTVSLFSGGGLLDLGFIEAGFKIIWANDNDKYAVKTYAYNLGDHIKLADITKLDVNDIPDCDVVIGGPPCQDFSEAGGGKGDSGGRGKLVWNYLNIIDNKKPKAFLFENVRGMAFKKHKTTLTALINQFKSIDYDVIYKLLNSWDFGVAQTRERLFICGIRKDLGVKFSFPVPDDQDYRTKTLEDVIKDLPEPNKSKLNNHANYYDNGFSPRFISRNRQRQWSEPSFTIVSMARQLPLYPEPSNFNVREMDKYKGIIPPRRFTVRECLRIQSVPDWYVIPEEIDLTEQYKIVGNGVPVKLAWYLAKSLSSVI